MRYGKNITSGRTAIDLLCGDNGYAKPTVHVCAVPGGYTGPTGTLLPPSGVALAVLDLISSTVLRSPKLESLSLNLLSLSTLLSPGYLSLNLTVLTPDTLRSPSYITIALNL